MAISRYRNANIIDGKYYETPNQISRQDLDNIPSIAIRMTGEDRLDTLAFKHLGSGEYWWIIALMNDIDWFFNIELGEIIRIPKNVDDVLNLL